MNSVCASLSALAAPQRPAPFAVRVGVGYTARPEVNGAMSEHDKGRVDGAAVREGAVARGEAVREEAVREGDALRQRAVARAAELMGRVSGVAPSQPAAPVHTVVSATPPTVVTDAPAAVVAQPATVVSEPDSQLPASSTETSSV